MSYNLNPPALPEFALPGFAIVSVEGPDATRFMNAQSMNDIAGLAVMDWHLDGWLTPQGRVIALFAVVKLSEERLLLVTPADGAAALVTGLQRFVFRTKVKLTTLPAGRVTGAFADLPAGTRAQVTDDGVYLRWLGDARSLGLHLTENAVREDPTQEAAWALQDLQAGLPWISAASEPHWTPQQLSLERWPAFSVKKGCYPGQEIVARTHFLGKGKRRLYRVRWSEAPEVQNDPTLVQGIGQEALCVLPMDAKDHPAHICGADFSVLPFAPERDSNQQ